MAGHSLRPSSYRPTPRLTVYATLVAPDGGYGMVQSRKEGNRTVSRMLEGVNHPYANTLITSTNTMSEIAQIFTDLLDDHGERYLWSQLVVAVNIDEPTTDLSAVAIAFYCHMEEDTNIEELVTEIGDCCDVLSNNTL